MYLTLNTCVQSVHARFFLNYEVKTSVLPAQILRLHVHMMLCMFSEIKNYWFLHWQKRLIKGSPQLREAASA